MAKKTKKKVCPEGLEELLKASERELGKGTLMVLGEKSDMGVKTFGSGSFGLDEALGGGYPRGRVIEVYGPEASGKTTLTLHAIAEVQRAGGTAAFIDAEHALDVEYAQALGVDVDALLISQPECGEQALEVADLVCRSGAVDLVVIDSVAALTPRAELEGDMGDSHVGLQARLMSQALRKLGAAAHRSDTALIFINQLRQKIGVMFGPSETTTGGNALKYYASVRLDVRRIQTLKDSGGDPFGSRVRARVVKNKVAPPFKSAEFDVIYGRGICRAGEVLDIGIERGVVDKSGAWLSWADGRLGQGRERARAVLLEDETLRLAIESKLGLGEAPTDEGVAKPAAPSKAATKAA